MLPRAIRDPLNRACCAWVDKPSREEQMRDDGLYYFRPTWIAGSILCYGKRKSHFPYHCMVGPDWFMVIIVYVLMFLVNGVVLFIVSPLGYVPVIIGTVGALWLLYIFSATAFTDSGIVYSNDYTKNPVSTQTTIAGKSQSSSNATPATILADRHSSSETEALVEVKDPLHVHDHHCDHKRPSDIELVEQEHAEGLAEDTTSSPVVASAFPQQLPLVSNHHNMPAVPTYEETVHTMECGQCQIQRPYSARHCHYCEVCVDHLDHHCPWCGKCIGEKNIRYFNSFLTALFFQFYYLLGTFIYFLIYISTENFLPAGPHFRSTYMSH